MHGAPNTKKSKGVGRGGSKKRKTQDAEGPPMGPMRPIPAVLTEVQNQHTAELLARGEVWREGDNQP